MHSGDLTHSINNTKGRIRNNNPLIPDVPFHPGPVYRSPPKPIRHDTSIQGSQSSPGIEDINPNINFDFGGNSPFQEGAISETFQRSDKSFFQDPKELGDLIDKGNLVQKFLSKQSNIDKNLPVDIKEIQARYLYSSFLRTYSYIYSKISYHPLRLPLKRWKL